MERGIGIGAAESMRGAAVDGGGEDGGSCGFAREQRERVSGGEWMRERERVNGSGCDERERERNRQCDGGGRRLLSAAEGRVRGESEMGEVVTGRRRGIRGKVGVGGDGGTAAGGNEDGCGKGEEEDGGNGR
ncbi:uncharacterized protein LOC130965778 [Arachis stenosperma]|uniref:uncharacterized protein LOC130965778 n=1 Tax=Arachis stenosperma TaxID=217475 RepID=UPI0025AD8769|nr:uncharacterized protein LOC130965778 [Arachis stenosperma]